MCCFLRGVSPFLRLPGRKWSGDYRRLSSVNQSNGNVSRFVLLWEPSLLLEGFGVAQACDVETKQLRDHTVVCQKFTEQDFDSFPGLVVSISCFL